MKKSFIVSLILFTALGAQAGVGEVFTCHDNAEYLKKKLTINQETSEDEDNRYYLGLIEEVLKVEKPEQNPEMAEKCKEIADFINSLLG